MDDNISFPIQTVVFDSFGVPGWADAYEPGTREMWIRLNTQASCLHVSKQLLQKNGKVFAVVSLDLKRFLSFFWFPVSLSQEANLSAMAEVMHLFDHPPRLQSWREPPRISNHFLKYLQGIVKKTGR